MTRRYRTAALAIGLSCSGLLLSSLSGCGESRLDKMRDKMAYDEQGKKIGSEASPSEMAKPVPAHPTRESLRPLLSKLYGGERLPDVLEGDIEIPGNYEISAGALSRITLKQGATDAQKVKAIIQATAEADAWVHRSTARKNYAEHIHKVFRAYGKEQREAILSAYAELKLLDFFNGPDADAAIAALPADVKGPAEELARHYKSAQQAVWDKWMSVKMYARREVSSDEPFRPVLRGLKERLGKKEPPPLTWESSHDKPFAAWAKQIDSDKELFALVTNLRELREQLEFKSDTHTQFVMEDSPALPEKAKGVAIDKRLGFGIAREDLGGGFSEMVFVFSKKLSGPSLKKAYFRAHLYRQLLTDYMMLATAGSDFEGRLVPEKYEPAYALCGSEAALDSAIYSFKSKYPFLADMKAGITNGDKLLERAHKCIIALGKPDIKIPAKDDDTDLEGPAPASRLAFFQMLARFENAAVDVSAMRKAPKKDQAELDAEAFLKANKNSQNE
jgi:hypothetical protein